jgi:uridine kinase
MEIPKENIKPFLIGICGGPSAGKSLLVNEMSKLITDFKVCTISQESYYKDLTKEQSKNIDDYNFDSPEAFDLDLLCNHLQKLRNGESIEMPVYDFVTCKKSKEFKFVESCPIIFLYGIFTFYDKKIRNLIDLRIFIDTDADLRLSKRIIRDITKGNRDLKSILNRYHKFVKPSFEDYILPSRKYADIIIPKIRENSPIIQIVTDYLRIQLNKLKGNASNLFSSINEIIDPKYQFFDNKILLSNDVNQIEFLKQIFEDNISNEIKKDENYEYFIQPIRHKLIEMLYNILINYFRGKSYFSRNLPKIDLIIMENDDVSNIDFKEFKNVFIFKTLILNEDDIKIPEYIYNKNQDCNIVINSIFLAPKFSDILLSNKLNTVLLNTLFFSDFFIKFEKFLKIDQTIFNSNELNKEFLKIIEKNFKYKHEKN